MNYRRSGSRHEPSEQPVLPPAPQADNSQANAEDAYWRDQHRNRPYTSGEGYSRWMPAFRHGWEGFAKHEGRTWEEAEPLMGLDWESSKPAGPMKWDRAKPAARDAWLHLASLKRAPVTSADDGRGVRFDATMKPGLRTNNAESSEGDVDAE